MCNGLEPIKKRFPLYPFLRQDRFIALFLKEKEREKAARRLRKRSHLPEPGVRGSQGCVLQAGLVLLGAGQMGAAVSLPPLPSFQTLTAETKAAMGRRKENTISTNLSPPAAS